VAEPRIGPFRGLDAGEAVELGRVAGDLQPLASQRPNRLKVSYEFGWRARLCRRGGRVDELRAEVDRLAGMLLGYAVGEKQ
jgi:hypothetical protein